MLPGQTGSPDDDPRFGVKILQATVLGEDLLVAFSDGSSALLAAKDVKHLARTAAKRWVMESDGGWFQGPWRER